MDYFGLFKVIKIYWEIYLVGWEINPSKVIIQNLLGFGRMGIKSHFPVNVKWEMGISLPHFFLINYFFKNIFLIIFF